MDTPEDHFSKEELGQNPPEIIDDEDIENERYQSKNIILFHMRKRLLRNFDEGMEGEWSIG